MKEELFSKKYGMLGNLCFILRNTMKCHPFLLFLCGLAVVIGVTIPVVTTFLPKLVIEYITS